METTWDRVLAWRMRRQFLADHDAPDTLAVVRGLAGVQAQVASSATAAVAVRRSGVAPDTATDTDGGVGAALADRALVRTWAMRGTLHLLPVDVAPAFLSLLAATRTWEKGAWQREFATAERMAALAEAVGAHLDGAALTREELVAALDEPALASGWGMLLKPLAWQGLLCNGPTRDGRPTFTSPRSYLPGWPAALPDPDGPDGAARTVIEAYLSAHGPASPATFDAWLLRGSTPKKRLRAWFADLVDAGALVTVDVEGEQLHARATDVDDLATANPVLGVRLLPGFDQYVLGPGTADPRIVAPEHRKRVSRAAGWIAPVVVADGRVVATWVVDGDVVTVEPFPGTPAGLDGIDEERRRWSALLGRDLTVRTGAA